MRRVLLALGLGAAALASAATPPAVAGDVATPGITVNLERPAIVAQVGEHFSFTATVTNTTDRTRAGLIAHLNVLSATGSTYIDPEDWSADRTQYLPPLSGHDSTKLSWSVQAVNSGEVVIYIAVVSPTGTEPVVASGPLRATVSSRRLINAGGILPLAVTLPTVMLVLMALTFRRRKLG